MVGAEEPALTLDASSARIGYVALTLTAPVGSRVSISELRGDVAVPSRSITSPPVGTVRITRAARWECGRRQRAFIAQITMPDGSVSSARAAIRTPGCSARFTLTSLPGRPRGLRPVTVRLRDRWKLGVQAAACVHGPAATRCSTRRIASGRATGRWRWRPARPGLWSLRVNADGQRVRRSVRVSPAGSSLRVLAAGDSMIQIIDGKLMRRLGPQRVRVRSDAHISTGITKPSTLNWVDHARADARRSKPDATVMFLGANDGYPLPTQRGSAPCCNRAWVSAYAARAGKMMRSYARSGRGRVYWMLLPTPRGRNFQKVFRGVNAALRRAAGANPDSVRLVDLGATFTPQRRFRQRIRWAGRTLSVRQADGVHLNTAGAAVAASLIIRALRRDGLL